MAMRLWMYLALRLLKAWSLGNLKRPELGIPSWLWGLEEERPYKGISNSSRFVPHLSSVSLGKLRNLC